jgi:O-antigen biosynthesis protein WbqP
MKRLFDIILVLIGAPLVLLACIVVAIAVKVTSAGPALHWSERIGRNNARFLMPKFRSMYVGTPQVATHVMAIDSMATNYITPIGAFIRKTSLDELPQFWSVLVGDMSLVGPRPALFNQQDLEAARTAQGVHRLLPGMTGWAQINGRDELPIPEKVVFDAWYLAHRSIWLDMKILALTVAKVLKRDGVTH